MKLTTRFEKANCRHCSSLLTRCSTTLRVDPVRTPKARLGCQHSRPPLVSTPTGIVCLARTRGLSGESCSKSSCRTFVQEWDSDPEVKRVQGTAVWEMKWAEDGRATWEYGPERQPGEVYVIWRRIGTHEIFRSPDLEAFIARASRSRPRRGGRDPDQYQRPKKDQGRSLRMNAPRSD